MSDPDPRTRPDPSQQRKRLRLESFDYSDPHYVYFVTICSRHLKAPFLDHDLASGIVNAILHRSETGEWRVFAYCLMPDHLHMALSPGNSNLSRLIQAFKSYTTRLAWKQGHKGALWQRSYYDHIARREDYLHEICQYILLNPVRKDLADDPDLWPYSGMPDPLPE